MSYKRLPLIATLAVMVAACTMTPPPPPNAVAPADIAGIVIALHEAEVQAGNAGRANATSADVRAFAQALVDDHTAALSSARDAFAREGITPAESDTSRALRSNAQTAITNLATYKGAEFDRRFMQSQIDMHRWAVDVLDTALIPSVTRRELRELLQTQRGHVAGHLERAQTIHRGL